MSGVDWYLRVEETRWNELNESMTLIQSVKVYRRSYDHYPKRVLADRIFRTRDNLRFCKECGIHMNCPRLGRCREDESVYRQDVDKNGWNPASEARSSVISEWKNADIRLVTS